MAGLVGARATIRMRNKLPRFINIEMNREEGKYDREATK